MCSRGVDGPEHKECSKNPDVLDIDLEDSTHPCAHLDLVQIGGPYTRGQVPPKVAIHALQHQVHARRVDCRDDVLELHDVRMPQLLEGADLPDGGVWEAWGLAASSVVCVWHGNQADLRNTLGEVRESVYVCVGRRFMVFRVFWRSVRMCGATHPSTLPAQFRQHRAQNCALQATLDEVRTLKKPAFRSFASFASARFSVTGTRCKRFRILQPPSGRKCFENGAPGTVSSNPGIYRYQGSQRMTMLELYRAWAATH